MKGVNLRFQVVYLPFFEPEAAETDFLITPGYQSRRLADIDAERNQGR